MGDRIRSTWVAALLFILHSVHGGDRQLIYTGWDSPTTAEFKTGLPEFEKRKLFDGVTILALRRLVDKSLVAANSGFSTNHWIWDEFADSLHDLEAARPQQCTNNFLMLTANPGNVGWFDDAGWKEVVDHWRLIARLAKKGNLSGICFDPEAYTRPWSQFLYSGQADKAYSFADTNAKARERGRAVMKAVAEEFPEITIFSFRLFADVLRSGDPTNPRVNLEANPFGLLPAFIDGWCDAMPPTVTLIEGNESAYSFESEQEYSATFARLKTESPRMVSPENRRKLRNQLLVGHGVYLDAYVAAPGAKSSLDLKGASPADRLTTYVLAALDAADGLVWIYGESARFWPKTNRPLWSEKFPGVETALRAAKDPTAFAKNFLTEAKPAANLLRDATFSDAAKTRSKAWSTWQESGSSGTMTMTESVMRLAGIEYGTISQSVTVKRGEIYAIGARVKSTGPGVAGISIGWQNTNGKWTQLSKRADFAPTEQADANGWRPIFGLVRVPPGAVKLGFLFFARKQETNGVAEFTDPVLLRVSN